MEQAEALFGPRDTRWFFTGLEYYDGDVPTTYYPGNRPFHIGIRLTRLATMDPAHAYFQLAHEVVHLLGPSSTYDKANVLEEGMATHFQVAVARRVGLHFQMNIPSYIKAMEEVDRLLTVASDAVRTIRAVYPDVRLVTPAEIERLVPGVPPDLATSLCQSFVR